MYVYIYISDHEPTGLQRLNIMRKPRHAWAARHHLAPGATHLKQEPRQNHLRKWLGVSVLGDAKSVSSIKDTFTTCVCDKYIDIDIDIRY